MTTATYLYCLVGATRKPASAGAPAGVPRATHPELIAVGPELWLVSASVPLDVYGPGKLEAILGDLDHVGRIAVAHEAVVEYFAARAGVTVVPLKLFTMFSTPSRAVADITARRSSIEAALRRIRGAEEWGIRVTASFDSSRSVRTGGKPAPAQPRRTAASGAAFLAAKKQARDDVREARRAATDAALAAFDRLTSVAREARRRTDGPSAAVTPPLLDAAFLVSAKDRARFTATARAEAQACARAGAHLTLTGPWPAYNFIEGDNGG